jgi:hypothetical protein
MTRFHIAAAIVLALWSAPVAAADYPPPRQGEWIARDFKFHTGELVPELRHTWLWGEKYPDFMDALAPMAAQPTAMSSRNWMMRRLIIDAIRNDPDWKDGNYKTQPRALKAAVVFFGIATSGGTLATQKMAPTRSEADKLLDGRLAAPFTADANDRRSTPPTTSAIRRRPG